MTEILILIVLSLLGTAVGISIFLLFQVLNELEEIREMIEERKALN
jgi:hypothetical protein